MQLNYTKKQRLVKIMKIAIIGGGASALMCACFAKGDVTIFEKAEKFYFDLYFAQDAESF